MTAQESPAEPKKEASTFVDDMLIHAKTAHAGETWEPLNNGSIDRKKWLSLLRRRTIEAMKDRFRNGLWLPEEGVLLHFENIISLITGYDDTGEKI